MARPLIIALAVPLLATAFLPSLAHAAQALDNCTGYIDTLPTTISTQGTWCVRKDLATAQAAGAAITVATNNVTVDCNDFKVGGLGAGPATLTSGVVAVDRVNVTVRRCNLRGFDQGIALTGAGSGHVVERNRLQANLSLGIQVRGEGSVVRDNAVFDTGGSTVHTGIAVGILTVGGVHVENNTITGVAALGEDTSALGVDSYNNAQGGVRGNRIRGLLSQGTGEIIGIRLAGAGSATVSGNDLVANGVGTGVRCESSGPLAVDNRMLGFGSGVIGCLDMKNVVDLVGTE